MTQPNIDPSGEAQQEAITDLIIAPDWETRFSLNVAGTRALSAELAEERDPERVIALVEQRHKAFFRGLGLAGLVLFKRGVLAERAAFEAEFGANH